MVGLTSAPPPKPKSNSSEPFYFRTSDRAPPIVAEILEGKGWKNLNVIDPNEDGPLVWNLLWKTGRFRPSDYKYCDPCQRLNHFPKAGIISRKDTLIRNLRKMKNIYGSAYDFFPQSFILPNEYTKFVNTFAEDETEQLWICKPADLSRGRKIFLIRDIGELAYDQQYVVQRYINSPLLINGYKNDLRIYVVVTSFHPLTVYINSEGLARYSTEKYDEGDHTKLLAHLTNSSLNKYNTGAVVEGIGAGCKQLLTEFFDVLRRQGADVDAIWMKIKSIIINTLLISAPLVPKIETCFELFGFDILLDQSYKPWLLEVNSSPALGIDNEVDQKVKPDLINDLVDLLDFPGMMDRFEDDWRHPHRISHGGARRAPIVHSYDPKEAAKQRSASKVKVNGAARRPPLPSSSSEKGSALVRRKGAEKNGSGRDKEQAACSPSVEKTTKASTARKANSDRDEVQNERGKKKAEKEPTKNAKKVNGERGEDVETRANGLRFPDIKNGRNQSSSSRDSDTDEEALSKPSRQPKNLQNLTRRAASSVQESRSSSDQEGEIARRRTSEHSKVLSEKLGKAASLSTFRPTHSAPSLLLRANAESLLSTVEEELKEVYDNPSRQGRLELIFPFSFRSEMTAIDFSLGKKGEKDFVAEIVEEVRARERKHKRGKAGKD